MFSKGTRQDKRGFEAGFGLPRKRSGKRSSNLYYPVQHYPYSKHPDPTPMSSNGDSTHSPSRSPAARGSPDRPTNGFASDTESSKRKAKRDGWEDESEVKKMRLDGDGDTAGSRTPSNAGTGAAESSNGTPNMGGGSAGQATTPGVTLPSWVKSVPSTALSLEQRQRLERAKAFAREQTAV
ncbi:hypothetical protein HK102_012969, partial [Quaeritorhiza haematococci]